METQRMIQEYVPGKQVTIAHLIANPDEDLFTSMGITGYKNSAIGLVTITPSESIIIAVDIAIKNAAIEIGFLDRFSGSLSIVGSYDSVKSALNAMIVVLKEELNFEAVGMTIT